MSPLDFLFGITEHLNSAASSLGPSLYALLFLIVFCETGLVVTPFLPGDSLLFACGAIAALEGSPLSPLGCIVVLVTAAILGDAVNYAVGFRAGARVFRQDVQWRWLNRRHLIATQAFYERHGGKTIILARFMPIVRTFAPFVAGVGRMNYGRFATFNVVGALLWVVSFVMAGYWFGATPFVKERFHLVILAIVVLSVFPVVLTAVRERRAARRFA